jgi:fructose-1,6-bisphosphatase I
MSKFENTTLEEFILQNRPQLLPLLVQLQNSAKIIASKLHLVSISSDLGLSGNHNGYGEEVQKLDEYANNLIIQKAILSGQVAKVYSEELSDPVCTATCAEDFILTVDPIDGSTNIDVSLSVGTIFGIYNNTKDNILPKGNALQCAGYFVYSNGMMLTITFGEGVFVFALDRETSTFFLSHSNIQIPLYSKIYSINEGNVSKFDDGVINYLNVIKESDFSLRYIGAMVPDIHRTIIKGGIYMYPSDYSTGKGKLRLLYEVSPMSFIIKNCGGLSIDDFGNNPLDLSPTSHDQTIGCIMGSPNNITQYQQTLMELNSN